MVLRSFYRPHRRIVENGSHPDTGEIMPSMTKQSFKAECDINNIIKQFSQTGIVTHISDRASKGQYADLPDSADFQEALNIVGAANESFMSLPSKVRDRFGNNPELFLQFLHDPKNEDEARALGLLQPKITPPNIPPTSSQSDDQAQLKLNTQTSNSKS